MKRRSFLRQISGAVCLAAARAETAKQRLIVDTHVEVWTSDPRFPFRHPEDPNLIKARYRAPVEHAVRQMQEFGIRYAVLVNPRYYGWDNSYISQCYQQHKDRFVAHGLINPEDPGVLEQMKYWVQEHGFQGIRFSPIYQYDCTWLNSKEHYPLWREAEKLGVVFSYFISPHQMPMLEEMAGRFPGVKIVIDYAGKPNLKLADPWPEFRKVLRLSKFPQVCISSSEPHEMSETKKWPYVDTLPFYKAIYEEFGGEQIIWSTGYPRKRVQGLDVNKEFEFIDEVCDFYTAEDRELILGKNALKIWRFPKSGPS